MFIAILQEKGNFGKVAGGSTSGVFNPAVLMTGLCMGLFQGPCTVFTRVLGSLGINQWGRCA